MVGHPSDFTPDMLSSTARKFLDHVVSDVPTDIAGRDAWFQHKDKLAEDIVGCLLRVGLTQADMLQALGKASPPPDWAIVGAQEWAAGSNDELELDNYPLASEGGDGSWVSAWVWITSPEAIDD